MNKIYSRPMPHPLMKVFRTASAAGHLNSSGASRCSTYLSTVNLSTRLILTAIPRSLCAEGHPRRNSAEQANGSHCGMLHQGHDIVDYNLARRRRRAARCLSVEHPIMRWEHENVLLWLPKPPPLSYILRDTFTCGSIYLTRRRSHCHSATSSSLWVGRYLITWLCCCSTLSLSVRASNTTREATADNSILFWWYEFISFETLSGIPSSADSSPTSSISWIRINGAANFSATTNG